mmetsp:Transcript_15921/g.34385  ORF Transcript_15921/g.34385 Transcript_15921/m.34385 type:complete len:916 (+) Transcript_15921:178-2925(+)|eukprot:CAMPEP_0202901644 /NCGR_PEP_ID=MMETSP1392-20130828/14373_1 /ASSEMBLY_ACC=CAM_ASM_000868 /TAXON_ID=225041 /ORGANISM="Chlamydomonas chlamydogama, Strain SAG 11-48b" /LENGTH=915 /DNA_ID=CAMNT_0049588237 /DNA_START=178 /DNA_END=2925 /DNA_ORIENTATION=+
MSSASGKGSDGGKKPAPKKADPIDVMDDTPFPVPDLYFKVYDSEKDEPESRVRRDVNKLYEKWLKEHGRRWPDKGLNTEDLVWLREEAYKPSSSSDKLNKQGQIPASQAGYVPVEKAEYDGEFLTEPGEDGSAAGAKKKSRGVRPMVSNYEATKAGGNWITDEFESEDYEAGNMELLWDMYLWDREGNPTVMPEGAPDEAAGEESENWDDFHTAYRPRYVSSDEAREAVWATDEFESDEDHTESEWEPEYVGAGLGLKAEDPVNPQYSLRHSTHPLAPFPGEALKWSSYVYDDGTTYEGLTRDAVPHGMGVLTFGNGTGGGFHFRDVRRGDKYEGEFQAGYAHGLGQFTSEMRGEVFIGEFFAGQRHGCGIKVDMKPFYYLLERGDDPVSAYQKTYDQIMRNIEFRTWYRNRALGSDYEDEIVLQAVNDEFDNPYNVVIRNAKHEQKLKDWKTMSAEEKAMTKIADIIEQVGGERMARRAAYGFSGPEYYSRDSHGRLMENLDSQGNDTEYDSMDLMVGNTTEGGLGPGWIQDTQDSEEFPMDPKLAEMIANDVFDDKREESEDKEMILGKDMINPLTGLSVKDYLDGKEGRYKEMMAKSAGGKAAKGGAGLLPGGRRNAFGVQDAEDSSYVESDDNAELGRLASSHLSAGQQELLLRDMERYDALYGSSSRNANPFEEGTDTRFETESDVMELCDLAEILGTVDEAREIVNRARMWRWKPYGEVTIRFAQDAQGAPVNLMQDPLHYPHGTKFMAPGPLGQCHPVPDDKAIRMEMVRVAKNYQHIYEMYNFDYDPEPGSVQYKIDQRIKRAEELRMKSLARMAEAADEELAQVQQTEQPLLASVDGMAQSFSSKSVPQQSSRFGSMGGPTTMFASMSFGMSRASKVVLNALAHAAKHAPAKRPRIVRPSQMRKQQ